MGIDSDLYDDFIKSENRPKKNIIKTTFSQKNTDNLISLDINENNSNRNKIENNKISSSIDTTGISVPKPKKKNDGFRFKNDKPKKVNIPGFGPDANIQIKKNTKS